MYVWLQVQGENKDVNVKRLAKRPIPPRFGRRLVATVATVIGGLVGVGILGYLGLALSQVN